MRTAKGECGLGKLPHALNGNFLRYFDVTFAAQKCKKSRFLASGMAATAKNFTMNRLIVFPIMKRPMLLI